jgi:hypothetical protein
MRQTCVLYISTRQRDSSTYTPSWRLSARTLLANKYSTDKALASSLRKDMSFVRAYICKKAYRTARAGDLAAGGIYVILKPPPYGLSRYFMITRSASVG